MFRDCVSSMTINSIKKIIIIKMEGAKRLVNPEFYDVQ